MGPPFLKRHPLRIYANQPLPHFKRRFKSPRFFPLLYREISASFLLALNQWCSIAGMAMADHIRGLFANTPVNLSELQTVSNPPPRVSMSPSSGEVTQTPEPKSTNGLVNVFKSLTGNKSTRSPHPQSPASTVAPQLTTANTLKKAIYGGPPNYEQLQEDLKEGNPLPERLAAAESLRHAVQDYPISGVSGLKFGCRT